MVIEIENEFGLKKWFEENFDRLGYDKIIRKDIGIFPDFIMMKDGEEIKVELETLSSNFILHNHDKDMVDEIVCIDNDVDLGIPTKDIEELSFIGGKARISATIDEENMKYIDSLLKNSKYRNKSHVIDTAIELLKEKEEGENGK